MAQEMRSKAARCKPMVVLMEVSRGLLPGAEDVRSSSEHAVALSSRESLLLSRVATASTKYSRRKAMGRTLGIPQYSKRAEGLALIAPRVAARAGANQDFECHGQILIIVATFATIAQYLSSHVMWQTFDCSPIHTCRRSPSHCGNVLHPIFQNRFPYLAGRDFDRFVTQDAQTSGGPQPSSHPNHPSSASATVH
jgi:hypothetical protein